MTIRKFLSVCLNFQRGTELEMRSIKDVSLHNLENRNCLECGSIHPQWASITYGIFICLDCAGIHRSLGAKISTVKSVGMDTWTEKEITKMESGGNKRMREFLVKNSLDGTPIPEKYRSLELVKYSRDLEELANAACPETKSEVEGKRKELKSSNGDHEKIRRSKKGSYISKPKKKSSSRFESMPEVKEKVLNALSVTKDAFSAGITIFGRATLKASKKIKKDLIKPATKVIKEKASKLGKYVKRNGDDESRDMSKVETRSSPEERENYGTRRDLDEWR